MNAATAIRLTVLWYAMRDAVRPIDRKIARAKFDAACGILDCLGMAHTETDAYMRVSDAFRHTDAEYGARPQYESSRNAEQKHWDKLFAAEILTQFS